MAKADWNEVKAILDNPNVNPDTKREILDEYLDTREDDRIDDEHKKYIKDYSPGHDLDDEDEGEFDGDDDDEDEEQELDEAVAKGKQEASDADNKEGSDKKANDANNQAKDKIGKAQPPALGGGGTKNSNELFDGAASNLEMFKRYLPAWNMRGVKHVDFQTGIQLRWEEQKGIDFQKFLTEADEFTKAKAAVDQYMDDVDGQLISLYGAWDGKAASASSQHYSGAVRPQLDQLVKQLGGAGETLSKAVGEIYRACKLKCEELTNAFTLNIGGAPPEMAKKIVTIAMQGLTGDDDAQRNQIKEVASWLDRTTGSATSRALDDDDCGDLEESTKTMVRDTCKKWADGPFDKEFGGKITQFENSCNAALTTVNAQWDSINNFLKGYEPKFPKDGTGGGGDTGGNGGGGSGSGGGGGGGTGSGGGGGMPKPPSMPELPKPEIPGAQDPSKLLDQTDPSKVPVPNDQQTVTIDDGSGRKIQVTEPTDDGKVKLMVTGPDGKPKPYEIDFQLPGEKTGQPGQPGMPGQPGGPGQQGGMPGAPHERLDVSGKPGGEQPTQIKPGPDGTASFRDGNSLITTQLVPGSSDQMKVTIDNMDGKPPTTYTVNFEDEGPKGGPGQGPGSQGGPGGQGGQGGMPRPMPLIGGEPGDIRQGGPMRAEPMPFQQQGPYQTEPAFGRMEPGQHLPPGQHMQPEPAFGRGGEPMMPQGAQGGPPPGWQGGPPQGPPPGWQGGPPPGWQGGPPPGFPPQGPPMGPPPGMPHWQQEPMSMQHGGPPPPPPGWQPPPPPQHMPPPQFGHEQGWQGGPPQGSPPPPPGWQPPPPPPPNWGGPQPGFAGGPFPPPQGFIDGTGTASAASGSYDLGHTTTSAGGNPGSPSAGSAFGGGPGQPASGGAGLSDTNSPQATGSGGAGLASVPDGGAWNQQQMGGQPPAGAPMGGGMPMGGGAGAGGGQGGDQERQASNWRTQGQYFSIDEEGERKWVNPVLGDDGFRDR
ncbi:MULTISPECIES: WXG100 family type VII secretion target [unclassified Crossiella]|uniref:WXG100 family type VII secretion target n=1 Tax=unclassified Crossiella TaxID=2620835 RepID=UPI0024941B2D|nr:MULTISPECIES: hypothetical protein [unclassified Crossiella]